MRNNGFLDDSVNIQEIARLTKNYTGAELEGVVKSAQSYALEGWKKLPSQSQTKDKCKIIQHDFLRGIG
jgi:vesicle-fusing ATPase